MNTSRRFLKDCCTASPRHSRLGRVLGIGFIVALSSNAWAGRPLSTDDAGTAEFGACQLESWRDRQSASNNNVSNTSTTVAPACGIWKGVELGFDYARERAAGERADARGVAVKWVPESWQVKTAAAEINAGLKFTAAQARAPGEHWKSADQSVLLMVSSKFSDTISAHVNLGTIQARRDTGGHDRAGLLNAAVVASVHPNVMLFIESQTNDRRSVFGPTVNTAGARFWIVPDKFGIDFTASRRAGASESTLWGIGFGWYGIGL